jgi:hypothetical protein
MDRRFLLTSLAGALARPLGAAKEATTTILVVFILAVRHRSHSQGFPDTPHRG